MDFGNEGGRDAMRSSIAICFAGSGGAGAITAGSTFLQAAARAGYYGLMTKLSGAQVRGGEAAALVEIGVEPLDAQPDRFDVLIALDWDNVGKFAPELPMDSASIVLADPAAGKPADAIVATGARLVDFPLAKLAADVKGRGNMVALGAAAALAGLDSAAVEQSIHDLIGGKGDAAIAASLAAVAVGAEAARDIGSDIKLQPGHPGRRWFGSGNEAIGLGALRGGVRFVAAYPITPATEITEWLAPRMKAVGASFGGTPSLTVTSGPGLSLKVETIGLAISAEIPLVIVDVMRVGPSTGIPTKSDQGDLDLALTGTHGDAPRIVLAPMSIADCALTTERAVHLAESLQTPVFVLSDQSLGQTQTIIDEPTRRAEPMARAMQSEKSGADFRRYQPTADNVSPMPAPGVEGRQWVAEGLSHDEFGHPSNAARFHVAGLDKRRDKLENHDYGDIWGEATGEGETVVIAFGSSVGPVKEAARRLREQGVAIKVVGLRLIAPIPKNEIAEAIAGARRVIVVEQNHTGQLYRHLLGAKALPAEAESLARPGPAPFRPGEIAAHIV